MRQQEEETKVIVDDTTIYEVDLNCYNCLSEKEKDQYFTKEEHQRINAIN